MILGHGPEHAGSQSGVKPRAGALRTTSRNSRSRARNDLVSKQPRDLCPPAPSPEAAPASDHLLIDRVERKFGDRVALSNVTLSCQPGEIAVVIGGSGAGKTTLLKILIGLDRPTSGSVILDGVDLAKLSERELNKTRRKLGMVFQYSALLDSMNVLENVAFPLREHTKLERSRNPRQGHRQAQGVGPDGRRPALSERAFGWHEEARRSGPRPHARAAGVALRRAHQWSRPDHQPPPSTT